MSEFKCDICVQPFNTKAQKKRHMSDPCDVALNEYKKNEELYKNMGRKLQRNNQKNEVLRKKLDELESKCIYIVGFGSIGKRHLQIIKSVLPNCKVYIVHHQHQHIKYTKDEDKLIQGTMFSYKDALNACNKTIPAELVFICNPSPFHLDIAKKFANCSSVCGIFIEKPISNTTRNVGKFLEYCKKHKVIIQVGYNLR